jgi:hypothetical protein
VPSAICVDTRKILKRFCPALLLLSFPFLSLPHPLPMSPIYLPSYITFINRYCHSRATPYSCCPPPTAPPVLNLLLPSLLSSTFLYLPSCPEPSFTFPPVLNLPLSSLLSSTFLYLPSCPLSSLSQPLLSSTPSHSPSSLPSFSPLYAYVPICLRPSVCPCFYLCVCVRLCVCRSVADDVRFL